MANSLPNVPPIPYPFAQHGNKNDIPDSQTQAGNGQASWNSGFPPETSLPVSGGGIPPSRPDMNGVLNVATFPQFFFEQGGFYTYDANVANAIGGYPIGAILTYYDSASKVVRKLRSTVANNYNNFVANPSVIGAAWEEVTPCLATGGHLFDIFPSFSTIPPVGSVPLDGRTLLETDYPDFYAEAVSRKAAGTIPTLTALQYNSQLTQYGQCGSFVVDTDAKTVRIPTIKSFIQNGTPGTVHSAGLPNITGQFPNGDGDVMVTSGQAERSAYMALHSGAFNMSGGAALSDYLSGGDFSYMDNSSRDRWGKATFDASRCNSAYGAAETVQPESVEIRYYLQVQKGNIATAVISSGVVSGNLDVKGRLYVHSGIELLGGGIVAASGGAWIARQYLDSAGSSGSAYATVSSAAARLGVHVNGSNADASLVTTIEGGVVLNHSGSGYAGRLYLSSGALTFSGSSGSRERQGVVALLSDITSGGAVFSGGEVAQSTWFQSNVTVSGALHGSGGFMATALYSGSANWYARAGVHPHMENSVYPQVEQFVEWINSDYYWAGFTAGVYNGARLSYSYPQMDVTVLAGSNGVTLSAGNEGAMPTGASVKILNGGITMSCMSVNADDFYVYGSLSMGAGGIELRHYVDDPEPGSPRERLLLSGGNLVFSGSSGSRERQGVVALLSDITSGAIVSGAEINTQIGPYRITATSGGLAVSGSGASVFLSGGQIAASAGENGGSFIVTSGGVEMRGALGDAGEHPYISVGRDGIAGNDGNGVGYNMGGYQFNINAEEFNYNSRPVAAALVTSTDSETTSAYIEELTGGMSYKYTQPLYSLEVASVTKTTDASYLHFTLDSVTAPTPVVISGVSYLNSATFEGGKEYLLRFFDGMMETHEIMDEPEQPVDGQTGV